MSTLLHRRGSTALIPQKESGAIQLADRVTCVDVYLGPSALVEASLLCRGTYGSGARLGWVCTSSKSEPLGAGTSKLTINWEMGGPAANPLYAPADEWECEILELNPKVERHYKFNTLSDDARNLVYQAYHGSTTELRTKAQTTLTGKGGTDASLGGKLLELYRQGVETYYLAGIRYSWTQYLFTLPAMDTGGYISSPSGPMAPYLPAEFDWLVLSEAPASAGVNGSMFKLTATWLGGPEGHWDSWLYA